MISLLIEYAKCHLISETSKHPVYSHQWATAEQNIYLRRRNSHRDLRHYHPAASGSQRPTLHAECIHVNVYNIRNPIISSLVSARAREPRQCRCTEQMRATDEAGARAPKAPSRVRSHSFSTRTRSKLAGAPPPTPETAGVRPKTHNGPI